MNSKLVLVPTPIGNLEDITLRALNVLKTADIILAEDTRVSKKLLTHYSIDKPLMPYHQHNEHQMLQHYIGKIQTHALTALLTDAGTPGISDPGFLIVRECLKCNIEVECLPGATAFVPALVASGLPCDRFYFYGFLPRKKGRMSAMQKLQAMDDTFVLYESPFRLVKTLEQLLDTLGNRNICVGREITKIYEEYFRGTISDAIGYFGAKTVKGEIVIIVSGNATNNDNETDNEDEGE